jgi:hypothetical protein
MNDTPRMDMLLLSKVRWPILLGSAVFLSCGLWQSPFSQAASAADSAYQERTPSVHEFRESDYRDPRFLDSRYHHDHYYPPIGSAFDAVPSGYQKIYDPEGDLYFAGGVWYREEQPGRYVVVSPEIGTTVPVLPPHYTTVLVQGIPYYYANSIYYLQAPDGYLVVDSLPDGVVVGQPPAEPTAAPRPSSSGTELPTGGN